MRRLFRLAGAAIAGFVAYRLLRRRRSQDAGIETEPPPAPADERAEELRRRLEEARALEEEREAFEEGETAVDEADPDESPEARRQGVHEQGKAAAEEMRSGGPTRKRARATKKKDSTEEPPAEPSDASD
jgi:hypothetical protein